MDDEYDEYVAAGILPPDLDPEEVGAVVRDALGRADQEEMCRDCGLSHVDPAICEPEVYPSSPRHPDPICHECGGRLGDADRAEAYLDPASLKRRAGGQDVLVDELPEDAFGPFLLHADPCYMSNRDKYSLA